MPKSEQSKEQAIRERAYLIWEREGRPEGRARDHWYRAVTERVHEQVRQESEPMEDEEKILEGRPDANIPALLTKDVRGG